MKQLCLAVLLLAGTGFAQEDKLIAILKSDAPLKEKADACRELARVGTRQAVPALASLLADQQLSHRARVTLVPIADPSVDAALREALGNVQARLLVGVIDLAVEGLKEEASVAAVAVAEKIVASHPAEVVEVMKQVQTNNSQVAGRGRQVLAPVPANAAEAGFTPIFNGQDLSGWDGKPGWWTVEDGALTAESTPEKPCKECNYLIWRGGRPADFELIAEFRLSAAGNSGIQLRSQALPNWDTSGYQADMSGDGGLVGFVYEHKRGLIAGRGERVTIGRDGRREVQNLGNTGELAKNYKKEGWNTYRITCRGPEITLWVNGTLMCQFADHDAKQAASKGIIALQMHPGPPMKIQFRNLRLKELK